MLLLSNQNVIFRLEVAFPEKMN